MVDANSNVVRLQNHLGDVEYELQFDKARIAQTFCNVVAVNAQTAQADQARVKLGHEHLIQKRQSILFAETIALEKEDNQPSMPLTTGEVLANLPEPVL